jgi:predicted DNA binding CopG/RHH family protein
MENRITVRLDEETLNGLRREQSKKNCKLSTLVRDALQYYLNSGLLVGKTRNLNLKKA